MNKNLPKFFFIYYIFISFPFFLYSDQAKLLRKVDNTDLNYIKKVLKDSVINPDHSFLLDFPPFGEVFFVTVNNDSRNLNKVNFYLIQNFNIIYKIGELYGNGIYSYTNIKSVGFKDTNGNEYSDIIIIGEGMTGIGANGAIPYLWASVYFNDGEKGFYNKYDCDAKITDLLNNQKNFNSVSDIYNYLKNLE